MEKDWSKILNISNASSGKGINMLAVTSEQVQQWKKNSKDNKITEDFSRIVREIIFDIVKFLRSSDIAQGYNKRVKAMLASDKYTFKQKMELLIKTRRYIKTLDLLPQEDKSFKRMILDFVLKQPKILEYLEVRFNEFKELKENKLIRPDSKRKDNNNELKKTAFKWIGTPEQLKQFYNLTVKDEELRVFSKETEWDDFMKGFSGEVIEDRIGIKWIAKAPRYKKQPHVKLFFYLFEKLIYKGLIDRVKQFYYLRIIHIFSEENGEPLSDSDTLKDSYSNYKSKKPPVNSDKIDNIVRQICL